MKLDGILKQAQQMQERVKQTQVTGEAGAGMVTVQMNGTMQVLRVNIDPAVFNENKDMLEDLLAAAVNDGVRKAQAAAQEKMEAVTKGMNLPDGFKMPF